MAHRLILDLLEQFFGTIGDMLKHVLSPLILVMLMALAGCAGFGGDSVHIEESGLTKCQRSRFIKSNNI